MNIAELRHGPLDEVAWAVDMHKMNEIQLRSVLLNLIDHIERIEKRLDKAVQA